MQLEFYDERLKVQLADIPGEWAVVQDKSNRWVDPWWNNYDKKLTYLVSLKDGTRKLLSCNTEAITACYFSVDKSYLVYFDSKSIIALIYLLTK